MIQKRPKEKTKTKNKSQEAQDTELLATIIDGIQDIKGRNIVQMDLSQLEDAPTNAFIICEGESVTQMRAISNNICKRVKEELNLMPNHSEGMSDSKWILVDYFTTIVHIFYPETRSYYDLEGLWNDAVVTEIRDFDKWETTS